MRWFASSLAFGVIILISNTFVVGFALFSTFTSKLDIWLTMLLLVIVGFASGLVVREIQSAFAGSLVCFAASLGTDAMLVGAFTYLYPTLDGTLRQLMVILFLSKVLVPSLVILLPVYMLSWILGTFFSEFLVGSTQ